MVNKLNTVRGAKMTNRLLDTIRLIDLDYY